MPDIGERIRNLPVNVLATRGDYESRKAALYSLREQAAALATEALAARDAEVMALKAENQRLTTEVLAWRNADLYCDMLGYLAGEYEANEPDFTGAALREIVREARDANGQLQAAIGGRGEG